ncbi:hypothetical protein KKB40_00795 [Patescibacteria group bacterium]|nr:hypothetical protein [Patescibacteria group bacterium]
MTGPIVHDGYCGLKKLQQALYGPGKIILTSYRTPWSSIKIGTSSSSVTKYWVGNGVLENREGKFVDRILSLQQFNKVKDQPHEVVQTDLIPLKNFKEIWVYPEELRFS